MASLGASPRPGGAHAAERAGGSGGSGWPLAGRVRSGQPGLVVSNEAKWTGGERTGGPQVLSDEQNPSNSP